MNQKKYDPHPEKKGVDANLCLVSINKKRTSVQNNNCTDFNKEFQRKFTESY